MLFVCAKGLQMMQIQLSGWRAANRRIRSIEMSSRGRLFTRGARATHHFGFNRGVLIS